MDLIQSIESKSPFAVTSSGEVKTLGFRQHIRRCFDSQFERERLAQIAEHLTEKLSSKVWGSLSESNQDPLVSATRRFLRSVQRQSLMDPRIAKLRRHLLAAKLNLPFDALEKNPDFASFAEKHHLDRLLLHYHHSLDLSSGEIRIQNMPWSEVPEEIRNAGKDPRRTSQPWIYGEKGLQFKDMFQWTRLEPYKHEDPANWNRQYVFEYCVCCESTIRLQGDHTWFRLKTPEGDVYSIGLYRPSKHGKRDNYLLPFRVKEGFLMQPDISEFYPYPTHTVQVAITREQFERIKQSVEHDKTTDSLNFLLLEANCTAYTNKKAEFANVRLPTAVSVWEFITPQSILNKIGKLPNLIKRIASAILTPLGNLITLILGSGTVDRKLKAKLKKNHQDIHPHLKNVRDLFNPEKLLFHPPLHVANHVFPIIRRWREEQLSQIEDLTERQNILYSLPPQFRIR